LVTAILLVQPVSALAAGATHVEFSIVGDVAACPEATYTVQSGSIREVIREGESRSGNQMFTITEPTPGNPLEP
jgi:hypothetical protein